MIPIAKVGERILLESRERGAPPRIGEVVEVGGEGTGVWYCVRWADGRRSAVFPHDERHRLLCP